MKLKVLSWNIWCDGYFDEISRFLSFFDADIIGLQEVLPQSKNIPVIDFLGSLGYEHAYGPALTMPLAKGTSEEMGNAIFSKHKILGRNIHVLSQENKRIAVQADIEVRGVVLHVFSVHLLHTHQQPSKIQDLQTENLIKVLPKEKTIVMGDFNATPESNPLKRMKEVLVNTDTGLAPTWSVYPEGCPTCSPQKIDTRLDYIFTSRDLKSNGPRVEDSRGSDHLPISVAVEV